ncbi:hypothetical protein [Azohydromonas australica]|nr:hypothetical protein [Azohydromonas australica]
MLIAELFVQRLDVVPGELEEVFSVEVAEPAGQAALSNEAVSER